MSPRRHRYQGMTLEEVSQLDLAYAPPFSSVLDPLLIAATLLQRGVRKPAEA